MTSKINYEFMKPVTLSADLEAVVGKGPMPRSEVAKKIWEYVKGDDFKYLGIKVGTILRKGPSLVDLVYLEDQAPEEKINADEKLKKVFGGKSVVNVFEMMKLVSKHIS